MPQIPLYNRQARLPSSTDPFLENVEAAGRTGRAMQRTGQDLIKLGAKYREEQDTADVLNAMNTMAKHADDIEFEMKKRKGVAARGTYQETGKRLDEFAQSVKEGLTRDGQQMFDEKYATLRNASVGKILTHESGEHEQEKLNAVTAIRDTFRTKIRGGEMGVADRDTEIADMKESVAKLYEGQNTEFIKGVQEQKANEMMTEWVVARALNKPTLVLAELQRGDYDKLMGDKEKKAVQDMLDGIVKDDMVNNEFRALKLQFGNDYQGMLKEVEKIKNPTLYAGLRDKVKSDYHTYKLFEDDRKSKAKEAIFKELSDAMFQDVPDISKVNELLAKYRDSDAITGNEYRQWKSWAAGWTAQALQERELKNSHFYLKHPDHKRAVFNLIQRRGTELKESDITGLMTKDQLSGRETSELIDELKRYKEEGPHELNDIFDVIKSMESDKLWSNSPEGKLTANKKNPKAFNKAKAIELRDKAMKMWELFPQLDNKAKKKLVQEFIDTEKERLRRGEIEAAFKEHAARSVARVGGVPRKGGYSSKEGAIIRKPLPERPDDIPSSPPVEPKHEKVFDEQAWVDEYFPPEQHPEPKEPKKVKVQPKIEEPKNTEGWVIWRAIKAGLSTLPVIGPLTK